MGWRSLAGAVLTVLLLIGVTGLFVWQVLWTDPVDFGPAVAAPIVLLVIAEAIGLQQRIGRWVWQRSAAAPPGEEAADYVETGPGDAGEKEVREIAHNVAGCANGCVSVLLAIPLWLSPGLAVVLTVGAQAERAQWRAITRVYGEEAYASGVRIAKAGMLNTGYPAHPQASAEYRRRSLLPAAVAFFLTWVTADWLLRRYYGHGYKGQQAVIEPEKLRRWLARWLPSRRDE
ncbi:MAG TPA: hypothetical protein VKD90_27370 [Gemmataceae bacterium]|nr:hypothetical protein [Gemmataceae bacterium]